MSCDRYSPTLAKFTVKGREIVDPGSGVGFVSNPNLAKVNLFKWLAKMCLVGYNSGGDQTSSNKKFISGWL